MAVYPNVGSEPGGKGPGSKRKAPFSVAQARRDLREAERTLKRLEDDKVTGPQLDDAKKAVKEARKTLESITSGSKADRREARSDFMDEYYNELGGPWIAELVKRDPELRRLFEKAIRTDDVNGFIDDLYQSDWWNDPKRSGTWKSAFQLEYAKDKTAWNDAVKQAKIDIAQVALDTYGIVIPQDMLDTLARRYMYQGWGENNNRGLMAWLADVKQRGWIGEKPEDESQIGFAPGGSSANDARTWRDRAAAYGLDMPKSWAQGVTDKILDPKSNFTEDQAWNEIISAAEGLFPVFAGKLSKDRSVRDLGAGYLSQMYRYLELDNPDSIDLTDPLLQKAFTSLDDAGNPTLMPLWKFNQEIKKDDRWQFTNNSRDMYMNAGQGFLRALGFVG